MKSEIELIEPVLGQFQISESDYNDIDALRASTLKELARSPLHAKYAEDNFNYKKTSALKIGEAVHVKLLQLEKFKERFYCLNEKIDKRKQESRDRLAELSALYTEDQILSLDESSQVDAMCRSAIKNPAILNILKSVNGIETTLIWQDLVTCKARLDAYSSQLNSIIDIKTCVDASASGFSRAIFNYSYHLQAAHYLKGMSQIFEKEIYDIHFIFICIEKDPPYATAVYELSPDAIQAGLSQREQLIELYVRCLSSGYYPSYSNRVEIIDLPNYGYKEIENHE